MLGKLGLYDTGDKRWGMNRGRWGVVVGDTTWRGIGGERDVKRMKVRGGGELW